MSGEMPADELVAIATAIDDPDHPTKAAAAEWAGEHLARGFRLAVPWLSSAGYFELVRRHERLDCLRLTDTPAPPQGLAALLAEAAVVQRLQTGGRGRRPNEHRDTVG